MAIDLEAIKRKLNELNGGRNKREKLWKPDLGTYKVRVLPFTTKDGTPFIERFFYFGIAPYTIMCPYQFGKEDPVKEFVDKCFQSGKKEDRELANKIKPKPMVYLPIVVRGEEAKGVFLWKCSYGVYKDIMGMFLDEEIGDITDPDSGYDLKVTIDKPPGKKYPDTKVSVTMRPCKLTNDVSLIKQWMSTIPNIDDMFEVPSAVQLKSLFETWMNSGGAQQEATVGQERSSGGSDDELEKLEQELKNEVKQPAPSKKAVVEDDDDDEVKPKKSVKKSLDDAFRDLEEDD